MQLHRDRARFEEAGIGLVLIGQGTPEEGAGFQRSYELELPLLVDAGRDAYRAAGARVGTLSDFVAPGVVLAGIRRGLRARVLQGRIRGHATQLGGVLVVAPDGSIPYAHISRDASDTPANEDVIAAVLGGVGDGASRPARPSPPG